VIARRVNAERLALLGWSRAILMQMAHPLIAAGVADHSTFRAGRFASARRLHGTVRAMLALSFGEARARDEALAGIRAIHRRVHGVLREPIGPFPAGTPYSAEDPALVRWVHLTLLDSIPLVYERLVRPLTPAERDAYCEESAWVALALGAREDMVPRTWAAAERGVAETIASGTLAVGADARAIARTVLAPPMDWIAWPLTRVHRRITLGTLPEAISDAYGFSRASSIARARQARTFRHLGALRRLLPDALALWPEARRTLS
jgi:uncharacterized protein (DUF2236 family)